MHLPVQQDWLVLLPEISDNYTTEDCCNIRDNKCWSCWTGQSQKMEPGGTEAINPGNYQPVFYIVILWTLRWMVLQHANLIIHIDLLQLLSRKLALNNLCKQQASVLSKMMIFLCLVQVVTLSEIWFHWLHWWLPAANAIFQILSLVWFCIYKTMVWSVCRDLMLETML